MSIQLVKCVDSLKYPEVDTMVMYLEWTYLNGIYHWQRKYENVRNNAVKLTDTAEYIYGLKEAAFIAIPKQYSGLCRNMVCYR